MHMQYSYYFPGRRVVAVVDERSQKQNKADATEWFVMSYISINISDFVQVVVVRQFFIFHFLLIYLSLFVIVFGSASARILRTVNLKLKLNFYFTEQRLSLCLLLLVSFRLRRLALFLAQVRLEMRKWHQNSESKF